MAGGPRLLALLLCAALLLAGCAGTPEPSKREAARDETVPQPVADTPADEAAGEPAPDPGNSAPPSSSAPGPPPQTPPPEGENTTVFEKRLDILLDEQFLPLPDATGAMAVDFAVEHPYQTLEVIGAYALPAWADHLQVTLTGPDGEKLVEYSSTDLYAVRGISGSDEAMPMGYVYDVEPGTYTLSVFGAGTTPVDIVVRGHLGAALDFTFRNIVTGKDDSVGAYRGKVVLVDLMATWCGPCKDAMPGLRQIRDDYAGKVEILSIDVDSSETDEELRDMRDEYKADWPFGFDDKGEASDAFGTGWIPSFGVVDQHGVLLFRHIGEMDPDDLRKIIDYALAERQ